MIDYSTVLVLGIKIPYEDFQKAYENKVAAGEDADQWYEDLVDHSKLLWFDRYSDPEYYIYAVPGHVRHLKAGECVPIREMWQDVNIPESCQAFIEEFMDTFPGVHPIFDVYAGLQVS